MELSFTDVQDAIEARLKTVDLGDDSPVHITHEEEDAPTAEMCPAVVINLTGSTHQVRYIVGLLTSGNPDEITVTYELRCWEFSANGTKDAARRRDALVRAVVDAVRGDRSLGGLVDMVEVTGIRFQTATAGSGIYSLGSITLQCLTRG